MKTLRDVSLLLVSVLGAGCFGGGGPVLVLENPPAEGAISATILSSALSKDEVELKVQFANHTDRIVVADRRLMVLSDGAKETGPHATTRYRWQIGPHQSSSAVKLEYRGADGTQPAYEIQFKSGAFRYDHNTGDVLEVDRLRLTVQKPAQ